MKAIQTEYKGCLFRSRLEARWAVFFDAAGINWEYEKEGIITYPRLTACTESSRNYLPDFWLPDFGFWAEVKGSLNENEAMELVDIAAYISSAGAGGCGSGNDVIVLGPIPKQHGVADTSIPWRLHMHKGGICAISWKGIETKAKESCLQTKSYCIATDWGNTLAECFTDHEVKVGALGKFLLDGCPVKSASYQLCDAYKAARSARFEHGHSGRTL